MKLEIENQNSIGVKIKSSLRNNLELIVLVLLVFIGLRVFVLTGFKVSTDKMQPTLLMGDFVFATQPDRHWVFRGDVVVFLCGNSGIYCVKRVIGLPGDRLEVAQGEFRVNRVKSKYPLWSEYLLEGQELEARVVPPGHIIVASDRGGEGEKFSEDLNTIPTESVYGKARFVWISFDWLQPWAGGGLPSVRWERLLHTVD